MCLLVSTLLNTQGRPSVDPQIFSLFTSLLSGTLSLQLLPTSLLSVISSTRGVQQTLSVSLLCTTAWRFFQDGSWAITGLTSFVAFLMGISVFHYMIPFVLKAVVSLFHCSVWGSFRYEGKSNFTYSFWPKAIAHPLSFIRTFFLVKS